jgi:fatty acid desaturase
MFYRLRQRVPLGGLTACVKCLTVVFGIALTPLYFWWPPIAWPFAVSAAALMLRSYSGVIHD